MFAGVSRWIIYSRNILYECLVIFAVRGSNSAIL